MDISKLRGMGASDLVIVYNFQESMEELNTVLKLLFAAGFTPVVRPDTINHDPHDVELPADLGDDWVPKFVGTKLKSAFLCVIVKPNMEFDNWMLTLLEATIAQSKPIVWYQNGEFLPFCTAMISGY